MSENAPRPEAKTSALPGKKGAGPPPPPVGPPPPPVPPIPPAPPSVGVTNWLRPSTPKEENPPPIPMPETRRLQGGSQAIRPALEYLPRVEGYELLQELGRGGMGVVYKAFQKSLQRPVALKMILAGAFATDSDIGRFRSEAMAIARLHHPHLLSIYEIGYQDGLPFFSMEYLDGGSLTRYFGRPQPPRVCATLLQKLAQAMAYAHQKGVIHRDLKPENILFSREDGGQSPPSLERGAAGPVLTLEGVTPKITDFGLAKQLNQDHFLTRTGDILGTPAYMAPEQAAGRNELVGPATDVYALGAILYELITGAALFPDASPAETLMKVAQEEPTRPRKLVRKIPVDLETVCLKCLEKDHAKRYAHAGELAADLDRFLAGEPVLARKPTLMSRGVKWVRRHPAKATLGVASVLILTLAFGWITSAWRRAELEAQSAQTKSAERAKDLLQAERLLGEALLDRGLFIAERGDEARGLHWMLRSLEFSTTIEEKLGEPLEFTKSIRRTLGSWTHDFLPCEASLTHDDWAFTVAYSPDGRFAVTGGADRCVKVWDSDTGKLLDRLDHLYPVWKVVFDPTGRHLFSVSGEKPKAGIIKEGEIPGELRVYTSDDKVDGTFRLKGTPVRFPFTAQDIRMDPTGMRLLTQTLDGARIWGFSARGEGSGLSLIEGVPHHRASILSAAFSGDGQLLVTGGLDGAVSFWQASSGTRAGIPFIIPGAIEALRVAPDGKTLAVACSRRPKAIPIDPAFPGPVQLAEIFAKNDAIKGMVLLIDLKESKQVGPPIVLPTRVKSLAFSPDGETVLTGGYDIQDGAIRGEVRLWHTRGAAAGKQFGKTIPHPSNIWDIQVSPNGRLFLTGCEDWHARLFTLADQTLVGRPLKHEGNVVQVAFHPRGRSALTASAGGNRRAAARLWPVPVPILAGKPLPAGSHVVEGKRLPAPINSLAWEPDAEHVWSASGDGKMKRWKVRNATIVDEFALDGMDRPSNLIVLQRGAALLVGSETGSVMRYDIAGRRTVFTVRPPRQDNPRGLMLLFPDNDSFLTINHADGATLRYDVRSGERLGRELVVDHEVRVAAISPDGRHLATVVFDRDVSKSKVAVRDLASGKLSQQWDHPDQIFVLAFTPDGLSLVTGGQDKLVQFWNLRTGKLQFSPLVHDHAVTGLAFSPDGQVLATSCKDGPSRMWDLRSGRALGKSLLVGHSARAGAFRPDGKVLAIGSETDGQTHFYQVPQPVAGSLAHLRTWIEVLTGMEMTSNDVIVTLAPDVLLERRQRLKDAGGDPSRPRDGD